MKEIVLIIATFNPYAVDVAATARTLMYQEVNTMEECQALAGNAMNTHASMLASAVGKGKVLQVACVEKAMTDE